MVIQQPCLLIVCAAVLVQVVYVDLGHHVHDSVAVEPTGVIAAVVPCAMFLFATCCMLPCPVQDQLF